MKPVIFREYDIRGIVGTDFIIENMPELTRAILSFFLSKNSQLSRIVIACDGRIHSPAIKQHALAVATHMGFDILDIGICPTPVFYHSLFTTKATSGFIITASHNPKEYNGIKICLDQKPVWGEDVQSIRTIYESQRWSTPRRDEGTITTYDANTSYVAWIKDKFPHLVASHIRASVDCGNGTAGATLPLLVKEMGWRSVKLQHSEVDGTFPNHEADPTKPKNMEDVKSALRNDSSLEVGIGFDGDCDRMAPMTPDGYLIPGDELLALYGKDVVKNNPHAPIVCDIKSSLGLIESLKAMGARDHIAPSGHSKIKNAMVKHNALLAGELSCHFFFKDRYFGYDDGIYAMVRLFEIITQSEKTLQKLLAFFPKKISSPEIRISCSEEKKDAIINEVATFFAAKPNKKLITIDGIRVHQEYGWGLARASNTQAVICLRFESDTREGLLHIKEDFACALRSHFSEESLHHALDI